MYVLGPNNYIKVQPINKDRPKMFMTYQFQLAEIYDILQISKDSFKNEKTINKIGTNMTIYVGVVGATGGHPLEFLSEFRQW